MKIPSVTEKESWLVARLGTHWEKGETFDFLHHCPHTYFNKVLIPVNELMLIFHIYD